MHRKSIEAASHLQDTDNDGENEETNSKQQENEKKEQMQPSSDSSPNCPDIEISAARDEDPSEANEGRTQGPSPSRVDGRGGERQLGRSEGQNYAKEGPAANGEGGGKSSFSVEKVSCLDAA